MLVPGGTVLVMDEKVAETFTAPGDDIERYMYGYSIFVCLANGLADRPSAATGTVMRPDTLRRYAAGRRVRADDRPADRARGLPALPPGSVARGVAPAHVLTRAAPSR